MDHDITSRGMALRELTLYLIESDATSQFCAWLIRKVNASPGGYIAPPGTRVAVEREDHLAPVVQRIEAKVPDAWTSDIQEHLAPLIAAHLVLEMPGRLDRPVISPGY